MKKLFTAILGTLGVMVLVTPVLAATGLLLAPVSIDLAEKESFTLTVSINPEDIKNYTVKIELEYPKELLEVKSFSFATDWLQLNQPKYDLIDNTNGLLIKTAGFPGGVSELVTFGTVSFLAKKAGNGVIKIGENSFVLDVASKNVLGLFGQTAFTITRPSVPEEEIVPPSRPPLFDVLIKPGPGEVETKGEALISRVAPGEFLPISVKLTNFGERQRVDVTINYQILDNNNAVVITETETVAVETTASFVKNIQIPHDLPSGKYTAFSSIIYEDQEVPATSKFQFTVERKIAGIFVSQLIIYGIITILIGIVFAVVSRLIIRRRASRFAPHDYSDVSKQERLFYEIVSDIIMQMRYRAGDQAIEIAGNIDGLIVQEENGRVLKINKDPAEIIALLILQYQKQIGKKTKVLPRKIDKETKDSLRPVEKHLDIIKKYFQ